MMSTIEAPKKRFLFFRRPVLWLMMMLAIAGACFFGGLMAGKGSDVQPQISAVTIGEKLKSVSELATVKYIYTNVGQFQDQQNFYGVTIPFTKKQFIVAYDGVIRAGIDFSQVTVEVGLSQVTITLPAATILSHEIDENSLEVFDETRNIFNPITITDYTQFQIDQKEEAVQKAIDGGLLVEAEEQAQHVIRSLLEQGGLLPEGYSIVFAPAGAPD